METLTGFDHQPRTRLIFGADSVNRLGELALELGILRALIVTDTGLTAAGHSARVERLLQSAGIGTVVFDQAHENPTTRDVDACLQVARDAAVNGFIALGGGSSMDTAKGANFLLTNGGQMKDYWGVGKATQPMLPLVAIPTTAGTGSECQCAALIADERTHQKMACLDPKAAARIALLDPTLTLSQPPRVAACTGLDAIGHAVETAVTTKRNPLSHLYSQEAFRLCMESLPRVLSHPLDLAARGRMQLGAAFAGMAIENSMLGAAHAAANPLTAHCGVVHGQAVAMMLPHVVHFNAGDPAVLESYAQLSVLIGIPAQATLQSRASVLAERLSTLLDLAQLPRALTDCGVKRDQLPALAAEAARQWTAQFNPRPVSEADFLNLYQTAFARRPVPLH